MGLTDGSVIYYFEGGHQVTQNPDGSMSAYSPSLEITGYFAADGTWEIFVGPQCIEMYWDGTDFTSDLTWACIPAGMNLLEVIQGELAGMATGGQSVEGLMSALYAAMGDPGAVISSDASSGAE